jgi:hypothetical protein
MFCSGEKKNYLWKKDKTKMPRRKYVLAPFSRGILFYTVNRIEAKRPIVHGK